MQPRKDMGEVFRRLAVRKESRIEEGHLMPDHVHVMIAIPPKYAGSPRDCLVCHFAILREETRHTLNQSCK